ncbi:hypothetical protein JYT11_00025 [Planctomycetaceae bacterium AH-315-I19]|nr:hypothetical protein [Planctomycetaceae bacterium AH-315-I19]
MMTTNRTIPRTLRAALLPVAIGVVTLGGCASYESNRGAYDVSLVNVKPEIVQSTEPVLSTVPMVAEAIRRD